jgi:hypothetical protein
MFGISPVIVTLRKLEGELPSVIIYLVKDAHGLGIFVLLVGELDHAVRVMHYRREAVVLGPGFAAIVQAREVGRLHFHGETNFARHILLKIGEKHLKVLPRMLPAEG